MDLSFSPADEAFRLEVRAWIRDVLPDDISEKAARFARFSHEDSMRWHSILFEKGWVAPAWPEEFGGPGLSATERFILVEEMDLAGTPTLSPFGLVMVGPLIQRFGTDVQRERYLPKILGGEECWCQGYSEPNAGSDLAAIRTTAEDAGDHFVVNGQKTWTTYAQYADWIFCLVRTDPNVKKQKGISFLLIDMKSEGVEAQPMLTLGGTPAFCDTFFDNVKVPKENLLGPLNGGWGLAKALLGHERTMVAQVGDCQRMLRRAKEIARDTLVRETKLIDLPAWRRRIAEQEIRLKALMMANYRVLAEQQAGKHPGPEASILKLVGTELLQDIEELCMELVGENALNWFNDEGIVPPVEETMGSWFCYHRAATIYAGSNEIQKNILAKAILGLPSA